MSNLIKKSFLVTMVVMTVLWGVGGVLNVASANVASAGDLIKSTSSAAVYYLDASNIKHPFHHEREYLTWYNDFASVKTVPTDEMVSYTLGSTIVVRPGSRLVQYVEVLGDGTWNVANTPAVYAVSPNGALNHIGAAATAVALYGSNWESMIVPIPNYLAANYSTGTALTSASTYPTGTLVKTAASSQVYYIDGTTKKPVTDAGFTANRFDLDYVVTASSLSTYTDGTSITALDTSIASPIAGAGGGVATGTGLTVALNTATPGAQVTPLAATNVPLMKFNLTAGADGAVTVSQINIKRLGVGAPADFNYLYLYDGATRLTNGKTINSTTNVLQFTALGLSIAAGTTKTLTVSADIKSNATSGNVHYFSLESASTVSTTATVSGSFPVYSNTTTIGSSSAGSLIVYKNGTLSNPAVGQQNATIAQFQLTAGTGEDLTVNRLTLYEAGTVNSTYLSNLKLYQGTTLVGSVASLSSTGYAVFDLSATPYTIPKNTNRIFKLTADVSLLARNGDTIRTYIDQTTDVYAVGATYGYGSSVDIDEATGYDGTSSAKYSEVTVEGGQITVAMNGPITGTLTQGTNEAVLMNFSITSGVNAEIRSLRIELHNNNAAGANLDTDAADTTIDDCSSDYITNVKVIDVSNGESTSAVNCSSFTGDVGTGAGVYNTFTDYFTLTAGQTRNFAVKADLSASLTADTYYAILGSSATTYYTFSSTAIKNNDNNQYVTDIVPSTFTQGNNQTIAAAGLYIALSSNAVSTTIVQGTSNVTLAEFAIQALEGSPITISAMTLYGYVDGNGGNNDIAASGTVAVRRSAVDELGMSGTSDYVYVNNLVDGLKLYDKTTNPTLTTNLNGTTESFASATGAATFDNMNWTIPAGETHILVVKGNVMTSAFTNGDTGAIGTVGMPKYVKVNFADYTAITAVDNSNNSVTMADDDDGTTFVLTDGNGSATDITSSTYITIQSSGTLNVTAESNPAIANVVAGTSDVSMLSLKFQATNEAFNVNKFRIAQSQSTTYNRAVDSVTISYPNQAGTTVTATQAMVGGNADFNITSAPLYVPANTYKLVHVYFNTKAINQTSATYTGDMVKATFDHNTSFEAKGAGSSSTSLTYTSLTSGTDDGSDVTGNVMTLHGNVPTFTVDSSTNTALSNGADAELYRVQVTAAEGGTPLSLKKLSFKLSLSDVTKHTSTLYLATFKVTEGSSYTVQDNLTWGDNGTNHYQVYNGWGVTTTNASGVAGGKLSADGAKLYQNIAGQGVSGASASSTHDIIVVFNDDRLISAGASKYYIVKAQVNNLNVGGTTANDSMSMYIPDLDTATTTNFDLHLLEASCDGSAVNKAPGKYCLSTNGTANDFGAYIIWSDNTGTDGNNTHTDTANDATTSSHDWFNGYNLKTLGTVRALN